MLDLLWLVPALPFAGFLILALAGSRFSKTITAVIGTGPAGISAVISLGIAFSFITSFPNGHAVSQSLWTWIQIPGFRPEIALYLDALSLVMILVVTVIGFLILLYSSEFMADEEGYSRFFSYMNLFVGSMLILVLADNLLLLYLGWEGVGLCSYLLIGFWYRDPENGHAARKAFLVTRVGDTAMAIGLFILFSDLGTLQIQELMHRASQQWPMGSSMAVAAAALLLGGALGKSAQLPLQTWLPDAMAGPTPVSALIHAATMVTAGVYLIARTHLLFELAPAVQFSVAVLGSLTLLLAGFSALCQRNIKRVLAYSTMSQIGYMFLALGVGAWSAAIFHFLTHACFKALLFLGAGVVILALDHEHDMLNMGGLRKKLPMAFWTFLIGSASLSALPFVTAGFYSKEMILWQSWSSEKGGLWFWAAGSFGAFLTSLYTFRMVFLTFFGGEKRPVIKTPGILLSIPLIVLACLSIIAGFIELPPVMGSLTLFSDFIRSALPEAPGSRGGWDIELVLLLIASSLQAFGIALAYLLFLRSPRHADQLLTIIPFSREIRSLWLSGWGFDRVYDLVIVRPFAWMARINKDDFIDLFPGGIAMYSRMFHKILSRSQTGKVRGYAMGIAIGAILTLGIVVFL